MYVYAYTQRHLIPVMDTREVNNFQTSLSPIITYHVCFMNVIILSHNEYRTEAFFI